MKNNFLASQRNSFMELEEIYFWTATIHNWIPILKNEPFSQVIIDSLSYLNEKNKIDVFAFIIMPNHIHIIWRIKEMNGKETPQGSFLKHTAHRFKKLLIQSNPDLMSKFKVKKSNKEYEFWQRDPLAVYLYSKDVAFQKLDYIHNNPLADHWNLVNDPSDYKYSSCRYYELGQKDFEFLKDLRDEV